MGKKGSIWVLFTLLRTTFIVIVITLLTSPVENMQLQKKYFLAFTDKKGPK